MPAVTADTAVSLISSLVAPAIVGKPLAAVLDLITVVSNLSERVTFTRTLPAEPSEKAAVSRRSLFTGQFLNPDPPPPKQETVTRERPLHPALRTGLIQLLLTAAADQQACTVTELIAQLYAQKRPFSPLALHLDLRTQFDGERLPSQVTSLGYTTTGPDHKALLGDNGEKLQGIIRTLTEWLATQNYPDMTLHLCLRGGYGNLYDNNVGRILGTIYGLVQAARPYPVRLEDPFILDSREAQIETFKQLKSYLRIRQIPVQLAARAWVTSLDAVEQFIDADVVEMLHVDVAQFLSLPASLEAVDLCHRRGMPVMWGQNGRSPQMTAQIALAMQPDLVMAGDATAVAHTQDEINRTLAWLAQQQKEDPDGIT